ncbi:MAG: LLM class flavin-dependent oxidoreductase [Chloroflexi bacterium]|nr:LLM class flavin-dependent oxidoreductase [Chloroflexota bacterium]
MTDFRFGILLYSQAATWPELLAAARRVDRLDYDHLWTWDHLHAIVGDPLQPIYDGYAVLAAWAAATERTKLGLLVGANTFRNPGVVAKSVTTIDHVSGGRAILGIGGAWFEYEHTAHGIEFGSGFGERLAWLDESAMAIRTLLDGGVVTSAPGGHYAFEALEHHPRPLQAHLPIMIGGGGEKKTLRTVAKVADYWNVNAGPADLLRKNEILAEHCAAVGRDPAEISRTTNTWIIVRDTKAEAERVWAAAMARNRSDLKDDDRHRMFFGPPAYVAEKLLEHVTAGFDSTIAELPAPFDEETIERLVGEVKPLVDRG